MTKRITSKLSPSWEMERTSLDPGTLYSAQRSGGDPIFISGSLYLLLWEGRQEWADAQVEALIKYERVERVLSAVRVLLSAEGRKSGSGAMRELKAAMASLSRVGDLHILGAVLPPGTVVPDESM